MVDRVASFSQTSQLINNNLRIETEFARGQIQLSSGLKSSSFQGLASEASQILSLESDYNRITAQTENAQTALSRNQIVFDSIGSILTEAQGFLADLNGAISSVIGPTEIQTQAQNSIEQTASALNTQTQGRYLFAGSATNVAPVDLDTSGYGGAVIPSVVNTDYYQGNDYVHSVEVSDGQTIDYGVSADSDVFEQIIRAYDLVRTTPDDDATLEEAYVLLQGAIDVLTEEQAKIAQDSTAINNAIDENVSELNLIDNLLGELTGVDLAEVSVRISELQAQLEASYSVTADLLRLNLTDYL